MMMMNHAQLQRDYCTDSKDSSANFGNAIAILVILFLFLWIVLTKYDINDYVKCELCVCTSDGKS